MIPAWPASQVGRQGQSTLRGGSAAVGSDGNGRGRTLLRHCLTGEWANYNGSGKYTVTGTAIDACTGPGIGSVTIVASGGINLSSDD